MTVFKDRIHHLARLSHEDDDAVMPADKVSRTVVREPCKLVGAPVRNHMTVLSTQTSAHRTL